MNMNMNMNMNIFANIYCNSKNHFGSKKKSRVKFLHNLLILLNQSDAQTEDGQHQILRVRVTGDQKRSGKSTVKQNSVVPWEVVGDQVGKKVLSDGSWAGPSRVMSSLPPIFLLKIHFTPLRRPELLSNCW